MSYKSSCVRSFAPLIRLFSNSPHYVFLKFTPKLTLGRPWGRWWGWGMGWVGTTQTTYTFFNISQTIILYTPTYLIAEIDPLYYLNMLKTLFSLSQQRKIYGWEPNTHPPHPTPPHLHPPTPHP